MLLKKLTFVVSFSKLLIHERFSMGFQSPYVIKMWISGQQVWIARQKAWVRPCRGPPQNRLSSKRFHFSSHMNLDLCIFELPYRVCQYPTDPYQMQQDSTTVQSLNVPPLCLADSLAWCLHARSNGLNICLNILSTLVVSRCWGRLTPPCDMLRRVWIHLNFVSKSSQHLFCSWNVERLLRPFDRAWSQHLSTWLNKCWDNVETANVEAVWSGLYPLLRYKLNMSPPEKIRWQKTENVDFFTRIYRKSHLGFIMGIVKTINLRRNVCVEKPSITKQIFELRFW